jgi:hypothetical protein
MMVNKKIYHVGDNDIRCLNCEKLMECIEKNKEGFLFDCDCGFQAMLTIKFNDNDGDDVDIYYRK